MATEPNIRLEVLTNDQYGQSESDNVPTSTSPKLSAGRRLVQAREEQGVSVDEIAHRLRLLPWMIEAIESDDYERLSAPIFARGYIRNYASAVGVPEDEIMRLYDERRVDVPAAAALAKRPVRGGGKPKNNRPSQAAPWVGLVLLLGVLGLMSAWWFSIPREEVGFFPSDSDELTADMEGDAAVLSDDSVASASLRSSEMGSSAIASLRSGSEGNAVAGSESDLADSAPISSARDTGRIDPTTLGVISASRASADEVVEQDGSNIAYSDRSDSALLGAQSEPAATPVVANSASTPAEPSVAADGLTALSLRFSRDSWAEVRDARGKRLVYELGQEGNTVSVRGRPPFRVFLGFAPGVEIELNGQPYDVTQHARRGKTTARFRVGEGS